nr:MAG TPA: hypothetical protein [Bacteriophage sp.]
MEEIKLDLELKKQIIKALGGLAFRDGYGEDVSFYDSNDLDDTLKKFGDVYLDVAKELDVDDEGKYQYGGMIYRVYKDGEPTDMYIRETWSRSGSYFSDYYYSYDELELVEPYTKTITIEDYRVVE